MIIPSFSRHGKTLFSQKNFTSRPFFQWLTLVFNKIDMQRIEEFGPDRVCAEWCLRNGASVQWTASEKVLKDYNSLPPEGTKMYIQKIDATDSSISHHGFLHLRGCNHIREILLNNCGYLENEALRQLMFVKDSLEFLRVAECGNITDDGLIYLKSLTKLNTLELFRLSYVKDKKHVLQELKNALPKCKISTDFEGKTKMDLTRLNNLGNLKPLKKILKLCDMTVDFPYEIINIRSVNTSGGRRIIVEISDSIIFLPSRYCPLSDNEIIKINNNIKNVKIGILSKGEIICFNNRSTYNLEFVSIIKHE